MLISYDATGQKEEFQYILLFDAEDKGFQMAIKQCRIQQFNLFMDISASHQPKQPDIQPKPHSHQYLKRLTINSNKLGTGGKTSHPPNHQQKPSYRWQTCQHAQYVNFLIQRRDLFEMPLQRKITIGIHKLMSQHVSQRSSSQCRSHHQKMMLKYKNIDNIIFQHLQAIAKKSDMRGNQENNEAEGTEISGQVAERTLPSQSEQSRGMENLVELEGFAQTQPWENQQWGLKEIDSYPCHEQCSFDL